MTRIDGRAIEKVEEISFSLKYLDHKKYGFKGMNIEQLKKFDRMIDHYSGLSVDEFLLKIERCKDYKTDIFDNQQVIHFKLDKAFRIHGVILSNRFKILRIDPKHLFKV